MIHCFPWYNSLLLLLDSGWRSLISESSCWCVQQLVSVFKERHSEHTERGPLTQWSSRTWGACHCLPHARLSEDKHTRLQIEAARNRCSHSPLKSPKHTNKLPMLLNGLPAAFSKKGFCFNQPSLWSKIVSRCFQSTLWGTHDNTHPLLCMLLQAWSICLRIDSLTKKRGRGERRTRIKGLSCLFVRYHPSWDYKQTDV